MGVGYQGREAADRARTVKARRQGSTSGPYRTWGLVIPSWLSREICATDDVDVIDETMRQFEFSPEMTEEGILYRVKRVRTQSEDGWS